MRSASAGNAQAGSCRCLMWYAMQSQHTPLREHTSALQLQRTKLASFWQSMRPLWVRRRIQQSPPPAYGFAVLVVDPVAVVVVVRSEAVELVVAPAVVLGPDVVAVVAAVVVVVGSMPSL